MATITQDHRPRFRREARIARFNEITLTLRVIGLEITHLCLGGVLDWLNNVAYAIGAERCFPWRTIDVRHRLEEVRSDRDEAHNTSAGLKIILMDPSYPVTSTAAVNYVEDLPF